MTINSFLSYLILSYFLGANYWRTQSIARPFCNSRATCWTHCWCLFTGLIRNEVRPSNRRSARHVNAQLGSGRRDWPIPEMKWHHVTACNRVLDALEMRRSFDFQTYKRHVLHTSIESCEESNWNAYAVWKLKGFCRASTTDMHHWAIGGVYICPSVRLTVCHTLVLPQN